MQEIGEIVNNHTYTNKKGEKCQMNISAIPNNMETGSSWHGVRKRFLTLCKMGSFAKF